MPVGWYVVQPPTDGSMEMAAKKAAASMTGQQPEFGPMAAEMKPFSIQMNGWVPTSGPVEAQIKKLVANFSKDYIAGNLAASGKKALIASVGQTPFRGDLAGQAHKPTAAMVGAQAQMGNLAIEMKKLENVQFQAVQNYPSTVAGEVKKMGMSAQGAHSANFGGVNVSIRKTEASASGTVPQIELVSYAVAQADTVAAPSHQTGDTIIVFVSRTGSAALSLLSGWTNIANGSRAVGTGNWSARIAYKVAASSSETIGTWSTTERIMVLVYRNVSAIGASSTQIGTTSATVSYPALTLQATNGKSRVIRFSRGGGAARVDDTDLLTNAPIAGYSIVAGNDYILAQDTNGEVATNPVLQTQETTKTNWWWTVTVELRID